MAQRGVSCDICIMRFVLLKSVSWTCSNSNGTMSLSIYWIVGKNQYHLAQMKPKISIHWSKKTTLNQPRFSENKKLRTSVEKRVFKSTFRHLLLLLHKHQRSETETKQKDMKWTAVFKCWNITSPNWVFFYLQRYIRAGSSHIWDGMMQWRKEEKRYLILMIWQTTYFTILVQQPHLDFDTFDTVIWPRRDIQVNMSLIPD